MSDRTYSEINLHITWHTKNSIGLITPQIETGLHAFLKNKCFETPDVYFHAIGGTENHIHLAVSVEPTLKIDEWIGKLKGASSFHVNHKIADRKVLEWQEGYGVVSFGTNDLEWVVKYIANQKEHHKSGKIHERLERITKDKD